MDANPFSLADFSYRFFIILFSANPQKSFGKFTLSIQRRGVVFDSCNVDGYVYFFSAEPEN